MSELGPLHAAFDDYLRLLSEATSRLRADIPPRGKLALIRNPERELADVVESLEDTPQFKRLAQLTRSTLQDDFHTSERDDDWQRAAQCWFRRGRAYLRYARPGALDSSALFQTYLDAFKQRELVVRYLAPIEFVGFAKEELDCGAFQIRRFSLSELDRILQTDVNRVFYPAATADTTRLCAYWFLVAEESTAARALTEEVFIDLTEVGRVLWSYHPPPSSIAKPLRALSLFDWQQATTRHGEVPGGWVRFGLPIVFRVDDALLAAPHRMPDCSVLKGESVYDLEREAVYADLDDGATLHLEEFCRRIAAKLVDYREKHPWYFFEIAMMYFVRAFQTDDLEQMLWHTIALEALLGGSRGGAVLEPLRRRLSLILGETRAEQEQIRKRFKKLYQLRCDLVHGNRMLKSLESTYLAELRVFARRSMLWFTHWLATLSGTIRQADDASALPTQSELLSVLDLEERARVKIGDLIRALPREFPNVPAWRE